MALTPKNISETNLHRMWENDMSDDEKMERLFGGELKKAEAVQAAMNRLDRIMHEKPKVNDLRGREFSYDHSPAAPSQYACSVIDLNTYDGASEGGESACIGRGSTEKEALLDLLDQLAHYDEQAPKPRASRVIHSSPFEPPTYDDRDVTFDDGLTDDDAR